MVHERTRGGTGRDIDKCLEMAKHVQRTSQGTSGGSTIANTRGRGAAGSAAGAVGGPMVGHVRGGVTAWFLLKERGYDPVGSE